MADQENWKKVKGVWKRTKDLASKGALGTDKFRYLKKKKKKDYVTDPDATFGGKRIRIKDGPEIKVSNAQEDLSKIKRMKSPEEYKAKGGRAGFRGGGRTNLLEELGRVEGESSNRNRRAEISRVHGELNRGYKSGGAVLKGKKVGIQIK